MLSKLFTQLSGSFLENQYGTPNWILFPICTVSVFDIIIYNVKSQTEYDKYKVIVQPNTDDSLIPDEFPQQLNSVFRRVDFLTNHSPRRRFTYRTRFEATMEQNERIQELFGARSESEFSRLTPAEWRRYIYDRHLYALPLPDMAGRHRECSAEYYR